MGTFSSTLDTAAFIELGGDDNGSGAVFVDGTNVPDRPDGVSGITTITFLDLDGSAAGSAPVRQGGFFKAVLDGVDAVRWSVDGGTTIGGVLLSDEFRAALVQYPAQIQAAIDAAYAAAAAVGSGATWDTLPGKPTVFPTESGMISDATSTGVAVLTAADQAAARAAIGSTVRTDYVYSTATTSTGLVRPTDDSAVMVIWNLPNVTVAANLPTVITSGTAGRYATDVVLCGAA